MMTPSLLEFQTEMHRGIARLFDQPYTPPGDWVQAYFRSIYALAILSNPDIIIDVGTERGISTMALALALKALERPLSSLTTIDIDHGLWKQLPAVHADLLKKYDVNLGEIEAITGNFCDLWPTSLLPPGKGVFIFYDIHDYFGGMGGLLPSTRFVNGWLPHLDEATVLVDNMYQCDPFDSGLGEKMSHLYHPSTRKHWLGQGYYGFNECGVIVDWLNEHRGQLLPTDANQAYFLIREGKPL